MNSIKIEKIAKILHHNFLGMTDTAYFYVVGEKRRKWIDLEEWEKNDLKYMANAVLTELEGQNG